MVLIEGQAGHQPGRDGKDRNEPATLSRPSITEFPRHAPPAREGEAAMTAVLRTVAASRAPDDAAQIQVGLT